MSIFLTQEVLFRAQARKHFLRYFFRLFLCVFVLWGGCFCAFWVCFFLFFARQRDFFFGGGVSKTGNSRSAFVPLAARSARRGSREQVFHNTTPHDGRWRRSRDSRGRLGPVHGDRVVGSRESESDDSQTVSDWLRLRLQTWVALATANGQSRV